MKFRKTDIKMLIKYITNHPLFAGSFIMIIGSNGVSFLNYIYHFLMGRLLGPANYGELASIISFMGLLSIIPASFNMVIIKYVSSIQDRQEINQTIGWFKNKALVASLIFTFIILILVPFLSSFLKVSMTLLFLLALSAFFSLQSSLNRSILQGLLKFKEMILSILVENSAKLIFSIVLVYLGFQVSGAMFAFILAVFLGLYTTNRYIKYESIKQTYLSSVKIKAMLKYAIPVAIQYMAITSLYSSDVILVKHFFTPYDAGIYASLSTLGRIIFFGVGPIGAVMFPLVSQRNSRGQTHKKIFVYSFLASMILSLGILLIYWLYPVIAIKLLFGVGYLKAANLLVWFGLFISLFTLSSLLINYGLSLGKTSIVILPLIAAIAQIILLIFFHQTLFSVIFVSMIVCALLLVSLLIYSIYGKYIFK